MHEWQYNIYNSLNGSKQIEIAEIREFLILDKYGGIHSNTYNQRFLLHSINNGVEKKLFFRCCSYVSFFNTFIHIANSCRRNSLAIVQKLSIPRIVRAPKLLLPGSLLQLPPSLYHYRYSLCSPCPEEKTC